MMNKYTELSDFEINKKVASHYLPCDYNLNDHAKTVEFIRFLGDTAEYRVYGKFDPCNNPSDAWKIMMDNEISVTPSGDGKYLAFRVISFGGGAIDYYKDEVSLHENPLRSCMEVFLMIKDFTENEND